MCGMTWIRGVFGLVGSVEPGSVSGMISGEGGELGVACSDIAGDSEEMEVSGGVFKSIPVKSKGGSCS